jgi:hypothetical protein
MFIAKHARVSTSNSNPPLSSGTTLVHVSLKLL